jgi:hypothetical protein
MECRIQTGSQEEWGGKVATLVSRSREINVPLAAPPGSGSAGCAVGVVACLIDKRSLGERVLD